MRRLPRHVYLVMWVRPNGRRGRKFYVRGHAVGPWIARLARESCTEVCVLHGELRDESATVVPLYYDDEAVEKRLRWAGASELRTMLLNDDPNVAEWLMAHRGFERALGSVERCFNLVSRSRAKRTRLARR